MLRERHARRDFGRLRKGPPGAVRGRDHMPAHKGGDKLPQSTTCLHGCREHSSTSSQQRAALETTKLHLGAGSGELPPETATPHSEIECQPISSRSPATPRWSRAPPQASASTSRPFSLRRAPLSAWFGLVVLALYLIAAVFAPVIAPYSETELVGPGYAPWSDQFILGTDQLGRDFLSRLIYGARNTIGIAFLTTRGRS